MSGKKPPERLFHRFRQLLRSGFGAVIVYFCLLPRRQGRFRQLLLIG
jgi:hypothetical protein